MIEPPDERPSTAWRARLGSRLGMAVLGGMAALSVMWLESGVVSPADGDPQARIYLLISVGVWGLTLGVTSRLRRASRPDGAEARARSVGGPALVAVATGAMIGAGLFLALMPLNRYEARWRIHMAAMRVDLREIAEAQAAYAEVRGFYAASLVEAGITASEGVQIALTSDRAGWTASATHLALPSFGFPSARCVVFGGRIDDEELDRLSDGRVPLAEGESLCEWGPYVRR